jgi:hypothetical protein
MDKVNANIIKIYKGATMKTLKNGTEIIRKNDEEAKILVKNGYTYCKKSEYKKLKGKKTEVAVVTEKVEKADKAPKKMKGAGQAAYLARKSGNTATANK